MVKWDGWHGPGGFLRAITMVSAISCLFLSGLSLSWAHSSDFPFLSSGEETLFPNEKNQALTRGGWETEGSTLLLRDSLREGWNWLRGWL